MEKKDLETMLLNKCYRFLSFRARTEKEISQYIQKKSKKYENLDLTIQEELEKNILKTLKVQGLINDSAFISEWVSYRTAVKPRSRFLLQIELTKKGIQKDLIDEYFQNNTLDEESLAKDTLKQKFRSISLIEDQKKRFNKALSFLMRRGFSYSISKKAFEDLYKNQYNKHNL
jgi:regulatory protein